MIRILLIGLTLGACSCASSEFDPRTYLPYPVTDFSLNKIVRTDLGIAVDDSEAGPVDTSAIDRRLLKYQRNLKTIAATLGGKLDPAWQCEEQTIDPERTYCWRCLAIKILRGRTSACYKMGNPRTGTTEPVQTLEIEAAASACVAKGLQPTEACPCRFRAKLQDGYMIVTPPTVYLMDFAALFTSCKNIWATPFKEAIYADMSEAGQMPETLWNRPIPEELLK